MRDNSQTNYTIHKFDLHADSSGETVDLKPYLFAFEFYEDIHQSFMVGFVDLVDPDALIEKSPLIGEEWIDFELEVHGIHRQGERFIVGEMDIYKISDEKPHTHKTETFRLHTVSRKFKNNAKHRTRAAYTGTQDQIVATLVENQLDGDLVEADECLVENTYIFPNWHPVGCIKELMAKSISAEYNDPDFCFYEDFEGFHYVSTSYMIDKPIIYPTAGRSMFKNNIINIFDGDETDFNVEVQTKKFAFDMIDNMNKGLYGSTLIYHDLVNRIYRQDETNYADTFGEFTHCDDLQLLTVDSAGYEKSRFLYTPMNGVDNPGVYPDDPTKDQIKKLVIRQNQTEQNTLVMTMDGVPGSDNKGIRVGNPIMFDMKSIYGLDDIEDHEKLWGKLLITKIRHRFDLNKYVQFIELSKDAFQF